MADVGTGATIVFTTSAFTSEITAINGTDISRPSLKTSHLGTTAWDTFIPGDLADAGGVDLEFLFDPDEIPPVTAAPEVITITLPIPSGGAAGATAVGTGYIESWSYGVPLEELMTGSARIKWSGEVVYSDST